MLIIKVEPCGWMSIEESVRAALKLSKKLGCFVEFNFERNYVCVGPRDKVKDVLTDFNKTKLVTESWNDPLVPSTYRKT